ncbi:DUF72 domain-containing protein [Streptomyces sp. NPDC023838]|uniref:DUF72 domain-containing protein n=1 Tax=Streptomyces sp. NPDC023838 TaxID=3154325 RepID=UPI0033FA112E
MSSPHTTEPPAGQTDAPAGILVGTCSWTDPALVSSGWYPPGHRDAEGRLRHYASRFSVVETDSTYYALPSERNSHLWVERTPEGFTFDVKAFAPFTGHPVRARALPPELRPPVPPHTLIRADELPDDTTHELWRRFRSGVEPLHAAGRLTSVLCQFPPWLAPGPRAYDLIERCRENAGVPISVEFRNPGWFSETQLPNTLAHLTRRDIPWVAVDAPGLPPAAHATSSQLSVIRFHGRSPSWGTGSKEARYRHRYGPDELEPWVPRIRALARDTARVHVLFNNCCADAAVRAAETMSALLAAV